MDEIIELLHEKAHIRAYSTPQASEEQLIEAQELMLISPPPHYREFLLNASHLLVGSLEPANVSDPSAHTYLPELCAVAWEQGVPRYTIPICEHSHGYYCVTPDDTIVNFQDGDFDDQQWDTVWEWAQEVWLTS